MQKIYLSIFVALLFVSINIFSAGAQPCYTNNSITYAPEVLTAPTDATFAFSDEYSTIIPIGFSFCFYGNNYSQCVICSNGLVCFNTALATFNCPDGIGSTPDLPPNCIGMPWIDLYAPGNGTIQYQTKGTAPNRKFIVAFTDIFYSPTTLCVGDYLTSQVILYENLNTVEVHILNSSVCTASNNGRGVIGVASSNLSDKTFAYPSVSIPWTHVFTNEAFRFTPVCLCANAVEELSDAELNMQVFGNPSENNFDFSYELKRPAAVSAEIYNPLGERIVTLARDENQPSGNHRYGLYLPNAGIYFLKLRIGNKFLSKKFVITK